VLNPAVLELIPDNQLFHITHLIDKIKESGGQIGVYPVSEKAWIDVGQWAEYRKALKLKRGSISMCRLMEVLLVLNSLMPQRKCRWTVF